MKGAVWIGLVILLPSAAGMFTILIADAETFYLAPRWIVFSAALMFLNAGIAVYPVDTCHAFQLGGFRARGTRVQYQYFHPFSCNWL